LKRSGLDPVARVLLVEDHALLAQSLCLALQAESLDVEIAPLTDLASLIALVQADPPDVVLLDLDLGGQVGDGARLIRPFAAAGSAVLVVTSAVDRLRLASTLEEGAIGTLCKSEPFAVLLETVMRAVRGQEIASAHTRQALLLELWRYRRREHVRREVFLRLTPREDQVLQELANGKTVRRIAAEWVVSEATVRSQVRAVLSKLCVTTQLEAVALASRSGWLADPAGRAYRSGAVGAV